MKKKKILMIFLIVISIMILAVAGIVVYEKLDKNKTNDNSDIKRLYGEWQSTRTEIYENGEIKLAYIDTGDKKLHIKPDGTISICYIGEDEQLKCTDSNYSYIDKKLHVDSDTYLANESEVIFGEISMILKAKMGTNGYTYLYFERK